MGGKDREGNKITSVSLQTFYSQFVYLTFQGDRCPESLSSIYTLGLWNWCRFTWSYAGVKFWSVRDLTGRRYSVVCPHCHYTTSTEYDRIPGVDKVKVLNSSVHCNTTVELW